MTRTRSGLNTQDTSEPDSPNLPSQLNMALPTGRDRRSLQSVRVFSSPETAEPVEPEDSTPRARRPSVASLMPEAMTFVTCQLPQIPALQSEWSLEPHLLRLRSLLKEHGLMDSRGSIRRNRYHTTMGLILDSFKGFPLIYQETEDLIQLEVDFSELEDSLLAGFADLRSLQRHLREELRGLKPERPYSRYITSLRRVWRLNQQVYGRDDNVSELFDHILLSVKPPVYKKLGRELQAIDRIRWRTALPFDGPRSVLSVLQAALEDQEMCEDMEERIDTLKKQEALTNSVAFKRPAQATDRVRRTTDATAKPSPDPPKASWLEPWAKQFPMVYKCWGDQWYEELKALEEKLRPGQGEVKTIRSKGYGLVGFHGELPSPLKCSHREFVLKGISHAPAPPIQTAVANLRSLSVPVDPALAPVTQAFRTTSIHADVVAGPADVTVPLDRFAEAPFADIPETVSHLHGSPPSFSNSQGPSTHDRVSYAFAHEHKADHVRQVSSLSLPEPELGLRCRASFGDPSFVVDAYGVVDTAAGLSYLTPSQALRARLTLLDCPAFAVELADESTAVIRFKVRTTVTLLARSGKDVKTCTIDLFLFEGANSAHDCFVLLGRSALREFGVHTGPGLVYLKDGPVLLDHNRVHASVRSVCSPSSPDVERVLSWLVEKGWERLIRASGEYQFRLRPLRGDELRDTPEQTHTFEVHIPRPRTHVRDIPSAALDSLIRKTESAARGHLSHQSVANQLKATELIDEYVELQFWRPSTADECRRLSAHQPTPVFLIGGEGDPNGRKARLVCNFRPANKELPPAGNSDRVPSQLLAAMRLSSPKVILVTDASRAFYKLRLADPDNAGADQLWLVAATRGEDGNLHVKHFLCDRLAFGLAVGPSALVSTITSLMGYPRLLRCFAGWYIDDLIIAAMNVLNAFNDFSLIDALLRRVGHSLQRKKTWLIAHESARPEVLSLFGKDMAIHDSAKIFGAQISYESDHLSVSCDNADKVDALTVLSHLDTESTRLTKADFFKLGGKLGYDLPRQHAEERVLADCLRSLIGRIQIPWHLPIDLHTSLSEDGKRAVDTLRDWSAQLLHQPAVCRHSTPLLESTSPLPIEVHTDASLSGGGFIVARGASSVWEEAFRWTKTKVRWHSNRLECYTLWSAMRAVADILQCYGSCVPGDDERLSVVIFCDNRSSVSWAQHGNVDVGGKQQRRAMQRLIDAMADEVKVIRQYSTIKIVHLPGDSNANADRLSRLCSSIQPLLEGDGMPKSMNLSDVLLADPEEEDECDPSNGEDSNEPLGDDLDYDLENSDLDPLRDSARRCVIRDVLPVPPQDPISRLSLPIDTLDASSGAILDSVLSTDALIRFDQVRAVNVPLTDSWPERVAGDCYDVGAVCRIASVMRFVLRSWRAGCARDRPPMPPPPYPLLFTEDDRLAVARSLQQGLESPQCRFLHFDPQTEVWYNRDPLPTGQFKYTPFVPASAPAFQNKVISDAHRRCAHRGPDYTLAEVQDWSLARPMKRTAALLQSCLHCQVKRAKRGVHGDLDMHTDRTVLGPFESLCLDHLGLGNKSIALSAICRVTGFIVLVYCASHSIDDTWRALCAVLSRIPRRPRCFLTDKATHIFGKVIEKYQQHYGVAVEYRHTPASSPHENGQLERAHASALSVLKTAIHLEKLVDDNLTRGASFQYDLQALLDSVAYTLNQRPLHELYLETHESNRVAITPALLVYGPGVLNGVFEDAPLPECPPALRNLYVNWRSFYDSYYWKKLKSASARAMASQRRGPPPSFAVGEHILVYAPSANKLRLPFRVGKIMDIRGNQVIAQVHAKTITVGIHNICKLILRCDHLRTPYDVTRVGARLSVVVDDIRYAGTVTDESPEGSLLVRWDLQGSVGWPDEWMNPQTAQLIAEG